MLQSLPRYSPVFATPFPYIPVYVVTYNVIFSSVNLRNIVTDKVNVVIFTCDVAVFHKLFIIILLTLNYSKSTVVTGNKVRQ